MGKILNKETIPKKVSLFRSVFAAAPVVRAFRFVS